MEDYRGALGTGNLPSIYKDSETFIYIMDTIMVGNTVGAQQLVEFGRFTDRFFEQTNHVDGQKIPLTTFNVKFAEGTFMSTSSVFRMNVTSQEATKTSFNALTYRFKEEDFYEAQVGNVDLLAYALTATEGVMTAYTNYFLPGQKYITLLVGASVYDTVPPVNDGGEYMTSFGALRGEDVTNFLLKPSNIASENERNHFLAKKASAQDVDDIKRAKRLITSYKTYSKRGVGCLINPEELDDLRSSLVADTLTEDKFILGDSQFKGYESVKIANVNFIPFEMVDAGVQIYFDMGRTGADMGLKLVRPDVRQQGIKLMPVKKTDIFDTNDLYEFFQSEFGATGSKLFVAPVSWLIHARESLVILDSENEEATGYMGTTGVTAIEALVSRTRAMFQ